MRTVNTTAIVHADHTITVPVPEDIPPGPQAIVLVLQGLPSLPKAPAPLKLAPHPVGPADSSCTYRREDFYGNDGR